jgi:PAS domain S-box-containing protein
MDAPAVEQTASVSGDSRKAPVPVPESEEPTDFRSRPQAAVLAFGRRASTLPPLPVLVQDAGAMIAEVLNADLHGIGEVLDGGAGLILTVLGAQPEANAARPVTHRGPLNPTASAAAYAIHMAAPVVAANVARDPRFTDLFLRKLGVVSALTFPLHLAGKAFGVLAVYSKTPRQFGLEDIRFMETIGHLLTPSIARAKIEEELLQVRLLATSVLELTDSLVLRLDPEGAILEMNEACQRVSGFSAAEVRNQPLVNALVVPEEADLILKKIRQVRQPTPTDQNLTLHFESQLATKTGGRRHVVWLLRALRDQTGAIISLVMTGADRTESLRAPAAANPDHGGQGRDAKSSPSGTARSAAEPRPFQRIPKGLRKDLRSSPRRAFKYYQMIAPMFGGQLPARRKFFEVECEDLSAGGMGFYMNRPPDFDTLVVALGRPPEESYLTARVVRVMRADQNGERRYLVGCRFTGRVAL